MRLQTALSALPADVLNVFLEGSPSAGHIWNQPLITLSWLGASIVEAALGQARTAMRSVAKRSLADSMLLIAIELLELMG